MDKKKSILNVATAIFFRIALVLLGLFTTRYLIKIIGNEANGLNSLYTSIVGFLSIAELGVGTAISFSMYKPITEGNKEKVAAIYRLFVKIYLIIGTIIFVAGLCIMPALKFLAKDYNGQNLHLTFFIMLVSVVATYLFSAKVSVIDAFKNNYISTALNSFSLILQYALQITVLFATKSFVAFLLCRVVAALVHWLLVEIVFRKKYGALTKIKSKIDGETKTEIVKNTKAMFFHKIGTVLVNTADSLIISAMLGVAILGKYSNYITVMTAMTGTITLFFTPLTAIIGHLCAKEDEEKQKKYFNFLLYLNFIIGTVFFLGYYAVIDDVVAIFFGGDLLMGKSVSFIITVNYFIQFMRQVVLLFRDATGTFYHDRFKPLIEGVVNVVLSIIFAKFFGVVGVLVATVITNLLICHVVEPLVLFKKAFHSSPKKHYLQNYLFILVFVLLLVGLNFIMVDIANRWLSILANGFIAVGIALVPIILIFVFNKSFRNKIKDLAASLMRKIKKRKD